MSHDGDADDRLTNYASPAVQDLLGSDPAEVSRTIQELRQARDLFWQVVSGTEQSIIATDREARISVFSKGAERMLGYTAEEMLGRTPEILHDPEEIAARARELGVPATYQVFIARP